MQLGLAHDFLKYGATAAGAAVRTTAFGASPLPSWSSRYQSHARGWRSAALSTCRSLTSAMPSTPRSFSISCLTQLASSSRETPWQTFQSTMIRIAFQRGRGACGVPWAAAPILRGAAPHQGSTRPRLIA